jgi:anti-sigma factor RsiW
LPEECPEIEALAAYIDHVLSLSERRRIETHLAGCSRCRKTVALTVKSKAAVPDPSRVNRADA